LGKGFHMKRTRQQFSQKGKPSLMKGYSLHFARRKGRRQHKKMLLLTGWVGLSKGGIFGGEALTGKGLLLQKRGGVRKENLSWLKRGGAGKSREKITATKRRGWECTLGSTKAGGRISHEGKGRPFR